jgi:error-prone DNA polymerase
MTGYAELQVTSNFSFLRGASHMDELFSTAASLGLPALGITDRWTLAGLVRAWEASKTTGIRLVIGCRLDLADGTPLLVYPTDRAAYSQLCRLLTLGKGRIGKGGCHLTWDDLAENAEGMIGILTAHQAEETVRARLGRLSACFADRSYLALTPRRKHHEPERLAELVELARAARVPTVATGDVLYHVPERRILQDVVTCIREKCTIDQLGFRRERFVDRHLRPPKEMARLLSSYPDAVERSLEIVERCRFDMGELRYQYPNEVSDPSLTPQETLEKLTWEGAGVRYGGAVPDDVAGQLRHELKLIAELGYAPYFLTVHSIVRYACQSAGNLDPRSASNLDPLSGSSR